MVQAKFPTKLVVALILVIIFGIALGLRIGPFHEYVFNGDAIKFSGIDAYYHMRLVDN